MYSKFYKTITMFYAVNIHLNWSVIHTVKGFGIVNKAEIGVFLELSCFFHDPALEKLNT